MSFFSLVLFSAIIHSLFDLLILGIRNHCNIKPVYKCPYQIVQQQHPIILILSTKGANEPERLNIILNLLVNIFNHHDRRISENSIEFLRAVLLYMFSSNIYSNTVWKNVLQKSKIGDTLYQEIVLFSKFTPAPATILYSNNLLTKAIKYFMNFRDETEVLSLTLCLVTASINQVNEGLNIDANLNLICQIVFEVEELGPGFSNLLIMLLADLLQIVSPFNIPVMLKIFVRLIIQKQYGNFLGLAMVMDGLIQWVAYPSFANNSLIELEELIVFISTRDTKKRFFNDFTEKMSNGYLYFDDRIATYFEYDAFLRSIGSLTCDMIKTSKYLFEKYPLIPRGLFLCNQLRYDCWLAIFNQLVELNRNDKLMQNSWLMPYLYKLANEMHPKTIHGLLVQLTTFGYRDQVLSTIKALSSAVGSAYTIHLYLKLWKIESRTYRFLYEALKATETSQNKNWELLIAKANAIKIICEQKPTQHGAELVLLLSEILNDDNNFEVPIVLALETLGILCENHVVNIVSTWNAISFRFQYEKRPQVMKYLFNFFSKIPKLKCDTEEFQKFTRDIVERMWVNSLENIDCDTEICCCAIETLGCFPMETLTLAEVPAKLKKGVKKPVDAEGKELPEKDIPVPPVVFLNLMEQVYKECIDSVADIMSNYIEAEIKEFRGGIYLLPDGRPEPKDLKNLPEKSLLRFVGQHLMTQSRQQTNDDYVICGLLRSITPPFTRPIPPLDWSFLHEFFHNGLTIKHHCLRILGNQIGTSGSARNMVENYISDFKAENFQEEDIAVLYEKLPELSDYLVPAAFAQFLRYSVAYASSANSSHLLLEHILTSFQPALSRDCKSTDNFDVICNCVEQLLQSFDLNDELFEKVRVLTRSLPLKSLDRIITAGIQGNTSSLYKKALTLITEVCIAKGKFDNPLSWLTDAVERANNLGPR